MGCQADSLLLLLSPPRFSATDRIHGIWVFEEEHRDLIGLRMMECV